jgi:hypothetical protein
MPLWEPHWAFWQREVDAPRQRAEQARDDVIQQEEARKMYWRWTKRLNRAQQRRERRQRVRR